MLYVNMALIARVIESFTNRFLEVSRKTDDERELEPGDMVGICKCPECNSILEVRDVNGRPLK